MPCRKQQRGETVDIRIYGSEPVGELRAMASKSDVHRALICAAFSDRETFIGSNADSSDMEATAGCLRAAGTDISYDGRRQGFVVRPIRPLTSVMADCCESGSTLRFLIPVFAAAGMTASYSGQGRLPERPLGPILDELRAKGMDIEGDRLPLTVRGRLKAGTFSLPGDVSSQFITGLLLSFPLMGGASELRLTTELQSSAYVDMTMDTMKRFGVRIERKDSRFLYEGGPGNYVSPGVCEADGDWSNAAFFLAADSLLGGGHIGIRGLREDSVQGDRRIVSILRGIADGSRSVMDASEVPDLVPIVAMTMALSEGRFEIINAGRLRIKESDRLSAMTEGLRRIGAAVEEQQDGLIIEGKGRPLPGGASVSSEGDHRIAMAFSIGALFCREPVVIEGAEAVGKSYPRFFEDMEKLGVRLERSGA